MAADAAGMSALSANARFTDLAARLTARAQALAQARATQASLARKADPARWRRAALLWPLFTQG